MSCRLPAPIGMLVLDATEIDPNHPEHEPPRRSVLGFEFQSPYLFPSPITVGGIVENGFCLIHPDGKLEGSDGLIHASVREWIESAIADGAYVKKQSAGA